MAKAAPVSKFAPATLPEIPPIDGVRFSAGMAGVRYKRRVDVMLALFDEGTQVAGVFTRSKCPSAPVDWCRARLSGGKARALLVNSGNANAFAGKVGAEAVKRSAKIAAAATGAEGHRDLVKTPATAVPSSSSASMTSVRPA
jgi:glutamate N-acetyltransferase/amino-acid N-acetyltransferase